LVLVETLLIAWIKGWAQRRRRSLGGRKPRLHLSCGLRFRKPMPGPASARAEKAGSHHRVDLGDGLRPLSRLALAVTATTVNPRFFAQIAISWGHRHCAW
jgi:hypothetical protein